MRCNFCKSEKFSTVVKINDRKTRKTFSILQCNKCHLCTTSPMPKKQDLKKYYEGYRDQTTRRFSSHVENFIHFWHKGRVKHITKLKKRGNILDVGCGRALELEMLSKLGWSTYATELSRDIEQNLLKKGVKSFFGEIWHLKGKFLVTFGFTSMFLDIYTIFPKIRSSKTWKIITSKSFLKNILHPSTIFSASGSAQSIKFFQTTPISYTDIFQEDPSLNLLKKQLSYFNCRF